NRVLLNLLSNACKFTPEGGSVSVTLTQTGGDDTRGDYELRVKDTGIGMSEEFAKHVFEAYERENKATVANTQGTGLGMSIAKSIVDLVGGSIDVKTAPGKGTEFIIHLELPLAKGAKGESKDEKAAHEALPRFDGKRVLLADDSEINREIAEILLNEIGFEVESACNGQEACDMLFSKPSDYYDILLLDVQMPVMDGLEASRHIRAHKDKRIASLPIVAFTANAFKEDLEIAKEAGMDVFLCKPATQEQMAEAFVEAFHIAEKK
ncbi:MAG: response regulator, partial [Erysipelotrichaceae bacterium]|nr:response regulator [Erysipelotrichaceae bacterium]